MRFIIALASIAIVNINVCFGAVNLGPIKTAFLKKLISTPDSKVDIITVALDLAKEEYPDLDVKKYKKTIEEMANQIRKATGDRPDPQSRIAILNQYFYNVFGVSYDFSDPVSKKKTNHFLNGIIDTKRGNCITMPLLYLSLAQKLNYPIYPVFAPQHVFLRYVDHFASFINIEATNAGYNNPNSWYISEFKITDLSMKNGLYLETASHKEFIAQLLFRNAQYHFYDHKNHKKGLEYVDAALKMAPKAANIYLGKAGMLDFLRRESLKVKRYDLAKKYWDDAMEVGMHGRNLGHVKLDVEKYKKEMEQVEIRHNGSI